MSDSQQFLPHLVAVVGAGPAGLYAARELAEKGHRVFLFNRDRKCPNLRYSDMRDLGKLE